jgi:hypothetical protein
MKTSCVYIILYCFSIDHGVINVGVVYVGSCGPVSTPLDVGTPNLCRTLAKIQ